MHRDCDAAKHEGWRVAAQAEGCAGSKRGKAVIPAFLRSLAALLRPARQENALSEQIELCKAAMSRREERMQELWRSVDYPGMDEHIAALGGCDGEYSKLAAKQQRAAQWLVVLLRKRGRPDDLQLAEAVKIEAWP